MFVDFRRFPEGDNPAPPRSVKVCIWNTRAVQVRIFIDFSWLWASFPEVVFIHFSDCSANGFEAFSKMPANHVLSIWGSFWMSFLNYFHRFSVTMRKCDFCNPSCTKATFSQAQQVYFATFSSSFSEPVSGWRFERLFYDLFAIWGTLGEAFWRLWAQISEWLFRVLNGGLVPPPPPQGKSGVNPGG